MAGTADEVFRRALALLLAKDMDAFADLWAKDGVIEYPFAAPAAPARIEGREEVRRAMAGYPQMADIREYPSITVHRTEDPQVVVGEFVARGVAVATGESYEMQYLAVVTVRNGEIVVYRDYMSPVMAAQALGAASALISALQAHLDGASS